MSYICDGNESNRIAKLVKDFIDNFSKYTVWSEFNLDFKRSPFMAAFVN